MTRRLTPGSFSTGNPGGVWRFGPKGGAERGGLVRQKWVYEDVPAAQTEQKGGVSQPGQTVSGVCFEKVLGGHTMSEEVVGRNLGIVPAYLAPDVFDPGSQIVFVIRTAGRIAESVGGVVIGPAGQDLGFDRTGLADARTANDQSAGELDELPPTDRKVDDSMISSDSALVHTPSLALMLSEQEKNAKKLFGFFTSFVEVSELMTNLIHNISDFLPRFYAGTQSKIGPLCGLAKGNLQFPGIVGLFSEYEISRFNFLVDLKV